MGHQRQAGPILLLTLLLGMGGGCAASRPEQNMEIVLAQARAYNERDVEGIRATVTPDLRRHCQATPEIDVRSADEFIAFAESDWQAFPDGRLEVDRMAAQGDLVGIFGRFIGTQMGPMGPFPASGKRAELDFGGVFRIENDRIAEIWITWDNLTALTQLGHWPSNDAAAAGHAQDERDELNATESTWTQAIHAGDRERIVSYWTDDAVIYAAGGLVVEGKPAILRFVGESRDRGTTLRIRREPEKTVVSGSGDIGYTIGTYELRRPEPDGTEVRVAGRHLCTWRKTTDGAWRCMLEIHSPADPDSTRPRAGSAH